MILLLLDLMHQFLPLPPHQLWLLPPHQLWLLRQLLI